MLEHASRLAPELPRVNHRSLDGTGLLIVKHGISSQRMSDIVLWYSSALMGGPETIRFSDQVHQRRSLHLAHRLGSMRLDGDFADAEIGGNVSVAPPANDIPHDFALARRQRF